MSTPTQRLTALREEGDSFFDYDDGHVQAVVQTQQDNGRGLAIYQWSGATDLDHSIMAIEWLRKRFDFISVHGIGKTLEDGSARFWVEQARRGMVDQVFLDDASEVNVMGGGARKPKMG